jgi:drug/metabolite transporter (DMT)-like permease
MKGANTLLFVLAATHIAATEALVLESAYVVFSLALAAVFARARPDLRMWGEGTLLLVGVVLVQGVANHGGSTADAAGVAFGIGAALTYTLFLVAWAVVTEPLAQLTVQVTATLVLLLVALASLFLGGELAQAAQGASFWLPLSELSTGAALLQLLNGVFVVGVVYLLITIGLQRLQDAPHGANTLASLALVFAIPFTLIAEVIMGRLTPSITQLAGVIVFMVAFAILARDDNAGKSKALNTMSTQV